MGIQNNSLLLFLCTHNVHLHAFGRHPYPELIYTPEKLRVKCLAQGPSSGLGSNVLTTELTLWAPKHK